MKRLILISVICLFSTGWFLSCEKDSNSIVKKGSVEFSINIESSSNVLKSEDTDSIKLHSYGIIFSITKTNEEEVLTDYFLPLLKFGNSFTSNSIELEAGTYLLTKFLTINPDGVTIYAAPLENSPMSYLVLSPLPINFSIKSNSKTIVAPEVLPVNNHLPEDFGYVSFRINIIHPISTYAAVRTYNPLYNSPTPWHYAAANVTISAKNWSHTYQFEAGINKILVRGGELKYRFSVQTSDYDSIYFCFSIDDLKNASEANPLYLDINTPATYFLEIQPTPDLGMDATITDLEPITNFGNSQYWHTGYYTEGMLTIMRITKSLIHFDLSSLPKSARIKKVHLNLFIVKWAYYPVYDETGHNYMNWGARLQQIVEPWAEEEVTWSNQPNTISANEVYIEYHPELDFNGRSYDVTSLFVPMQEIAAPNFGMMLMTDADSTSPPVYFASSDYKQHELRPKLTIEYTLP